MKNGDNSGDNAALEKIFLLILAGVALGALTWIAIRALKAGSVDPNASALIGVIVTGLIAMGKDLVQAIRSYAASAQLGKVTDQLAASAPTLAAATAAAKEADAAGQDAGGQASSADVVGAADAVVDAAAGARDQIAEQVDRPRPDPGPPRPAATEIME
jgi:hypothetical protein